ncbi:hypothetical protein HDU99_001438 [Rhizoclosmatium hyalinum]|nr:hypothetical protein HDU99_001438 [Rhizoclosmatium hyalinum]
METNGSTSVSGDTIMSEQQVDSAMEGVETVPVAEATAQAAPAPAPAPEPTPTATQPPPASASTSTAPPTTTTPVPTTTAATRTPTASSRRSLSLLKDLSHVDPTSTFQSDAQLQALLAQPGRVTRNRLSLQPSYSSLDASASPAASSSTSATATTAAQTPANPLKRAATTSSSSSKKKQRQNDPMLPITCPVPGCKRTKTIASHKQLYFHMRDCHSSELSVKFRNQTAIVKKGPNGMFQCLGCDKEFASPSSLRTHASKCSVSRFSSSNRYSSNHDYDYDESGSRSFDIDEGGSFTDAPELTPLYEAHLNYRTVIAQIYPSYSTLPEPSKITIKKSVRAWLLQHAAKNAEPVFERECVIFANRDGLTPTYAVPDAVVDEFKEWVSAEVQAGRFGKVVVAATTMSADAGADAAAANQNGHSGQNGHGAEGENGQESRKLEGQEEVKEDEEMVNGKVEGGAGEGEVFAS